ncbi:MAG: hypothetical protein ACRC30_17365 [Clostridium sp.]
MKFFTNLHSKKAKKNYELLLDIKEELDQVSLNISILSNRIELYKKNSSLSLNKIESYLTKIKASADKKNISLCKKGFFKFHRENLIYDSIIKNSDSFSNEFKTITSTLVSLQDEFDILEQNFSSSINSNKFTFKDIFSQSISNFSNKLTALSQSTAILSNKVPKSSKPVCEIPISNLFENDEDFLLAFEDFLKKYEIIF